MTEVLIIGAVIGIALGFAATVPIFVLIDKLGWFRPKTGGLE